MDCQQCRRATLALAAAPVSCEGLPADSTTVLPAPLRFLPLHSQADASTDSSMASAPTDTASDYLEVQALPVPPCEATHASSAHTVKTWSQILGVTVEPTSISLDDIREAQSLDDNLQFPSDDKKPPKDDASACPEETPVIFGQWASVVPIGGTTYCDFDDATGPLHALVLPSASQARERYAQAMAFMEQQASSDTTGYRLCHSISVSSPSVKVDGQICLQNAVFGARPSNNKCPKIAKSQSTIKVSENNTEGTNTHCVDSLSHAQSVDRHRLVALASSGLGPPDRGAAQFAPVRRFPVCEPLIGWTLAPFWLLCPVNSQLLFTGSNKGISMDLCVVGQDTSVLCEVSCYVVFADMPRKRTAMPDVKPSDSESSFSESEAGEPPASTSQVTGAPVTELVPAMAGHSPVEGVGTPIDAPVRGGVTAGGRRLRRRGCKTTTSKCKYVSHTCGLCDHPHVFAARKGLNKHSTSCHGQYFSLAGNCFVPIRESDLHSPLPVGQAAGGPAAPLASWCWSSFLG